MDKNKCPKLKTQKNFPKKISYIDTTHEGSFFSAFFSFLNNFPSLCSIASLSTKI